MALNQSRQTLVYIDFPKQDFLLQKRVWKIQSSLGRRNKPSKKRHSEFGKRVIVANAA